jgi:hypothetical protein
MPLIALVVRERGVVPLNSREEDRSVSPIARHPGRRAYIFGLNVTIQLELDLFPAIVARETWSGPRNSLKALREASTRRFESIRRDAARRGRRASWGADMGRNLRAMANRSP